MLSPELATYPTTAAISGEHSRQQLRSGTVTLQGIRTTHEEFHYLSGALGTRASEVYTSLQSGSVGEDCNGHGTHVAACVGGLTFGPAKNSTLYAVRSLECAGNGTVSQVRHICAFSKIGGRFAAAEDVAEDSWTCLTWWIHYATL